MIERHGALGEFRARRIADGRAAKARSGRCARSDSKACARWSGDSVFTSGATEAAALAFGAAGRRVPTDRLDRRASRQSCAKPRRVERINVGVLPSGLVDPEQLATWIADQARRPGRDQRRQPGKRACCSSSQTL
jgi:cysteine sulfinate desulfinase/cysteine desulfurase-like protein